MFLTINIGNANILAAAYEGREKLFCSQLRTDPLKTADEYAIGLKNLLQLYGFSPEQLEGAILSCVAPALAGTLRQAVRLLREVRVLTVGPGLKTGLNIRIDNPAELGADIVATAVAALERYPMPCLLVNFDTAITVMGLDAQRSLIGGCISPGVRLSLEALYTHAAQLPQIDLTRRPGSVAGASMVASMEAGLILGTASMVDGLIDRFAELFGCPPAVVATGELCRSITSHCVHRIQVDGDLLTDGLALIYLRNCRAAS